MKGRISSRKVRWVLACAAVLGSLFMTAGAQGAARPHPHVGKLAAFPAIRGLIALHGSAQQISAHQRLVDSAFATVRKTRLGGTPISNETSISECEDEEAFFFTQDMCYRGGPVVRSSTLHLIFWQGSGSEAGVDAFPTGYQQTVEQYFSDVAHDSGSATNVFAVDDQYGEVRGREFLPGEYSLTFDPARDVTVDTSPFPIHLTGGCTDETSYSEGPCLLDADIQEEVERIAGPDVGLGFIYVLLTPAGVGGCFEAESTTCAYRQYCAYHGDFGGDGRTPGGQTLYADLPFVGRVQGCDSEIHPNSFNNNGSDAVIDDASHEVNETITDPLGSQCDEEAREIVGCEPNAWTDAIGQEVADKCLPPETTVAGIYGEPLGGTNASTLYNQLINGHGYWTQREWSNEAGDVEGGCIQRLIEASFTASGSPAATVPVTFDGANSGAPGDPAVYWVWDFGDGEQVGTPGATTTHTFSRPGTYEVAMTAYDAYGNAQVAFGVLAVGDAPPVAPVPVVSADVGTVKVTTPVTRYSASAIAKLLGLPANGKKLRGRGEIVLGHGGCPPACAVTLSLSTKVTSGSGRHARKRQVGIGTVRISIPSSVEAALGISLNRTGRALLHKRHTLRCTLAVRVQSPEGASWSITRTIILKR